MDLIKNWSKWKDVAELFLKDNKKVYIKDVNGTMYFAEILFVGEDSLRIQCFDPPKRRDEKFTIYYPLIEKFHEYVEFKTAKELE